MTANKLLIYSVAEKHTVLVNCYPGSMLAQEGNGGHDCLTREVAGGQ